MKILAFDTSGSSESAAVLIDGEVYGELFFERTLSHTETLLTSIQEALKQANLKLNQIDLFVATTGPGSFTGIRIALSTLKAFGFAHKKPIWGISSLLAQSQPEIQSGNPVLSLIHARLDEYYFAAYHLNSSQELITLHEPQVLQEKEIFPILQSFGGDKLVVSSQKTPFPFEIAITQRVEARIKASDVAKLGYDQWKRKKVSENKLVSPSYLRLVEAERKLLESEIRKIN